MAASQELEGNQGKQGQVVAAVNINELLEDKELQASIRITELRRMSKQVRQTHAPASSSFSSSADRSRQAGSGIICKLQRPKSCDGTCLSFPCSKLLLRVCALSPTAEAARGADQQDESRP